MLRGQQTVASLLPSSIINKPQNKGHRNVYIEERNEALVHRYYYYNHIKRLRYDDCLINLEKEFFITTNVILQHLVSYGELLKQLGIENHDLKYLRKKYPLFVWA